MTTENRTGAGAKARRYIETLTRRRDFLRGLADRRRDAGEGATLEHADAERLTWVIATLASPEAPAMTTNQRTAARKMAEDRRAVLEALPAPNSYERAELKAWDWAIDELARKWTA